MSIYDKMTALQITTEDCFLQVERIWEEWIEIAWLSRDLLSNWNDNLVAREVLQELEDRLKTLHRQALICRALIFLLQAGEE